MKSSATDMTGMTIGRLVVLGRAPREPRFGSLAAWLCRCECGKTIAVRGRALRIGTRSCGCLIGDSARDRFSTHAKSGTRAYRSWCAAKTRCYNPRQPAWSHYGGRGITMCDEWRDSFEAFLCDMGPCPPGHSIDRIDVNGNYEPGNCRWAPPETQANNTRGNRVVEFRGEKHTVAEWARIVGMSGDALKRRFLLGWSPERALTTPVR